MALSVGVTGHVQPNFIAPPRGTDLSTESVHIAAPAVNHREACLLREDCLDPDWCSVVIHLHTFALQYEHGHPSANNKATASHEDDSRVSAFTSFMLQLVL